MRELSAMERRKEAEARSEGDCGDSEEGDHGREYEDTRGSGDNRCATTTTTTTTRGAGRSGRGLVLHGMQPPQHCQEATVRVMSGEWAWTECVCGGVGEHRADRALSSEE